MGYDIQTKEQDTEYTRCVQRRSRDNDLFTEPEGYTSWVTRTKYEGLLNPENQLQTNLMKLYGIDIWPTPAMTTEVKSFLRFGNVDKEFIQDNWTLTEPLKNLFEMDETFQEKENGQDDHDTIILTEDLFLDLLDHGFDGKRTFENNDEQFDPIKTLSVHEPKTLHNHFSKVTAATSVNDVIAANVMNMDLRKWITMAQDMNVIVDNTINMLSEKKPNTWKDILEDWLIRILRSPNRNTEVTNCSILRHSETIRKLNEKQARQSLFLSGQPNYYTKRNTDNQNRILLSGKMIIETVDEESYGSIGEKNILEGILLPWNLQTTWKRGNNPLFYIVALGLGILPRPLLMDLLKSLSVGTVVEDHGSTEGVISRIPGISEVRTLQRRNYYYSTRKFEQTT